MGPKDPPRGCYSIVDPWFQAMRMFGESVSNDVHCMRPVAVLKGFI